VFLPWRQTARTGRTICYYLIIFLTGLVVFGAGQISGWIGDEENRGQVVYHPVGVEKEIALTFNVDGDADIGAVTSVLQSEGVPATFFVAEYWARDHRETVKQLVLAGHEVGCLFPGGGGQANGGQEERAGSMIESGRAISGISGRNVVSIRPMDTGISPVETTMGSRAKLRTVMWSLDTHDQNHPDFRVMAVRVIKKTRPGEVILFHPDSRETIRALPDIVTGLKGRGFEFDTASELGRESGTD